MSFFWRISIFYLLFYFSGFSAFSQRRSDSLYIKIIENQQFMRVDLESAYLNIETLLKEAIEARDPESEMTLLANKCRYFLMNKNITELIKASEHLQSKAIEYGDREFEVISKRYFAEAYMINEMYDDAIAIFKNLPPILDKIQPETDNIRNTRGNIYINISNAYNNKGDYDSSISYLRKVEKEYQKFEDAKPLPFIYYLHYSNFSEVYLQVDIDSSLYYVNKSIAMKPESISDDNVMITNYMTMGRVSYIKENYPLAIEYFEKAEDLSLAIGDKSHLYEIYMDLIDFHKKVENFGQINAYKTKLSQLEIEYTKEKNRSLHKILERERNRQLQRDKENRRMIVTISLASIGFVLLLGSVFYLYRRRVYSRYEKLSQDYLENNRATPPDSLKIYSELIELVKKNDKGFMAGFKKAFPDFSNKLLVINPNFAQSEIEFCALLKLNLSTKEIAQYKFIQPKTVQNKKHRIRKRLHIPENMDIYQWFHNF